MGCMKENTYHYELVGKKYHLKFYWKIDRWDGERFVILDNINALVFMLDMLIRLGYEKV